MMVEIINKIYQQYYKTKFQKKCNKIGQSVRIKGKVIFSGQGKLDCGDHLLIRSANFNPVRIHIESHATLTLGDKVFLNMGVHLSCSEKILIGSQVDFGEDCLIMDNDFHGAGIEKPKKAPIIIKDDVWLAARVIVLKGVTIGEGAVIGAGSVVTKSIPPNSFAAGVPAKVIKSI
tara:strand:+ start:187 stop:711 length:525 start_codon:yes stop_codon:yes gene_type:complete